MNGYLPVLIFPTSNDVTEGSLTAINSFDGSIRWRYSGKYSNKHIKDVTAANGQIYTTEINIDNPDQSAVVAVDGTRGEERR